MIGNLQTRSRKKERETRWWPHLSGRQEEATDCAEGKEKLGERYKRMKNNVQREEVVLLI